MFGWFRKEKDTSGGSETEWENRPENVAARENTVSKLRERARKTRKHIAIKDATPLHRQARREFIDASNIPAILEKYNIYPYNKDYKTHFNKVRKQLEDKYDEEHPVTDIARKLFLEREKKYHM